MNAAAIGEIDIIRAAHLEQIISKAGRQKSVEEIFFEGNNVLPERLLVPGL